MGVRVSVITPVYNMEETIEASARSVLGQTFADLELICVDDGSTDRTGAILDRLAQEDSRLRVIHQENRGVSAARNAGLAAAAGETVAWLDGDDQMGPQALEKLNAALLETGASMAICNYENVERSGAREKRYVQRSNEVISGEEALMRVLRREITQAIWASLAPRAFYRDITFPEGMVFEDVRMSYKLYEQAKTVALVNDSLLFSRLVRAESISHVATIEKRAASCEAYLIRQRDLTSRRPETEKVFVRSNYASLLLRLRASVLRDSRANFAANRAVIRDVCGYFRARTKLALGENAGMGKRLEYRLLTQGTRAGFFLSRVVSAGRRGGTWLR